MTPEATLSRGALWATPFVELVRLALSQGASGRLDLAGESVRRQVWWCDGLPVMARSNLLSENLLRLLLRRGAIERAAYTELLGVSGLERASLLEARGVSPQVLQEAEQALTEEIFLSCLSWTEAEYTFSPAAQPEGAGWRRFDPVALYVRWLREQVAMDRVLAEALRYRVRPLCLSEVGHQQLTLVETGLEGAALLRSALRRGDTVGWLLEHAGDGLEEVVRRFTALLHLGLITVSGSGGAVQSRAAMTASQGRLVAVRRSGGHGAAVLEEARAEVAQALARARQARSPREVFALPEHAEAPEVQEVYRALEERYRLDRFRALGDEALLQELGELRERLDDALRRSLKPGPPLSRPLSRSLPTMRARRISSGGATARTDDAALLSRLLFEEGQTYLKLGDFEEAADHFRQAHIHDASAPRCLGWYGWALTLSEASPGEGRYPQGRAALLEAIRRGEGLDELWVLLGNLLSREGDTPRALAAYHRALELNPASRDARVAIDLLA